jgi:hypothetical protein
MGFKWCYMILSIILICAFSYFGVRLYAFNNSNKPSSELYKAIITSGLIPKDMTINEINAKDLLLVSWDVNERTPRLFSKWSYANLKKPRIDHQFTLGQMTMASATTPDFFYPFTKESSDGKKHFYVSGDYIAQSPAMFAYMNTAEKAGVEPCQLRIVSVGSTVTLPEPFHKSVGILEWASRISSLSSPVKKSTMDYMTNYLLKEESHSFHKYQVETSANWEDYFYFYSGNRAVVLQQKYQEMVNAHQWDINKVLGEMVSEKFKGKCTKPYTLEAI